MNGVEERTRDVAGVVHVQIQTDAGRIVAERYGVFLVPTYLLFDRRGGLVAQERVIDEDMAQRLRELAAR